MADPTTPPDPNALPGLPPQLMQLLSPQQPTDTMGKITNFIGNPLVSGALGAYLGTIGQPRHMGLGHALSVGGLEGLGSFNQARMMQLQQPLMRANVLEAAYNIPKTAAQTTEQQSLGQLHKVQASQLGPQTDLADQYALMATQATDPRQHQNLQLISDALRSGGKMTVADAIKYANAGDLDSTKIALQQAQTGEAQAKAALTQEQQSQLLPADIAEKRASAGHLGAETGLATQQSELLKKLTPAALSGIPVGGGMSVTPPPAAPAASPESPAGGGDAVPPDLGFKPSHHVPMSGGGTAYYNDADKHWYTKGPSGWQVIP